MPEIAYIKSGIVCIDRIGNFPGKSCFSIFRNAVCQVSVANTHKSRRNSETKLHAVGFVGKMILNRPPKTCSVNFACHANPWFPVFIPAPNKPAFPGRLFCNLRLSVVIYPHVFVFRCARAAFPFLQTQRCINGNSSNYCLQKLYCPETYYYIGQFAWYRISL